MCLWSLCVSTESPVCDGMGMCFFTLQTEFSISPSLPPQQGSADYSLDSGWKEIKTQSIPITGNMLTVGTVFSVVIVENILDLPSAYQYQRHFFESKWMRSSPCEWSSEVPLAQFSRLIVSCFICHCGEVLKQTFNLDWKIVYCCHKKIAIELRNIFQPAVQSVHHGSFAFCFSFCCIEVYWSWSIIRTLSTQKIRKTLL